MSAERLATIPIRMKAYVDANQTAGIVTVVGRHGRVASFDAVGYQDVESKKPMRKDSLFRIASLTKPITCAGIMVLVDEGKISVIDPVEKYLPEYKGLKVRGCAGNAGYACEGATPSRPINIEDLMMHTSGLEGNSRVREGAEPTTLAELAALGAKTQLLFEPGTSWNYSNIGYNVLGRLIEVVSKQGYDAFLKEKIFEPLGMTRHVFLCTGRKDGAACNALHLIRFSTNKIAIATGCAAWSQDSYAGGWNREYGRGHLPLQYDDAEQRNSRRSPRSLECSGYSHDHFTHRQPQSRVGSWRRSWLRIRSGARCGRDVPL